MSVPGTTTTARATAETAQDEGRELAQSTKESTKQVAQTVKQEASNVAGEVASQAQSLAGEARSQVRGQVDQQKSRAAGILRTTGDELSSLVNDQEHSRLTAELTRRASEQARTVADYLENTEPGDVLNHVRDFARRKPGVFLLAAGVAGLVVGRVFRSATAGATSDTQGTTYDTGSTYAGTTYPTTTYSESLYPEATLPTGSQTTYAGSTSDIGQESTFGTPIPQGGTSLGDTGREDIRP